MTDINWSAEVRKLEREFSGLPPEPTAAEVNAKRATQRRAHEREEAVNATVGASVRVVLVLALAGALYYWPYARACGVGLYAFMGAETLIAAGAFWIGVHSWRHRMAKTHGLALAILLGGLVLLAAQVLPRTGYARTDAAHVQRWSCVSGVIKKP
jgi:hypothetical protein